MELVNRRRTPEVTSGRVTTKFFNKPTVCEFSDAGSGGKIGCKCTLAMLLTVVAVQMSRGLTMEITVIVVVSVVGTTMRCWTTVVGRASLTMGVPCRGLLNNVSC